MTVAAGLQSPVAAVNDFAALQFIIQQALGKVQTCLPVTVLSVSNNGDLSPVGRVSVRPLVAMTSGDGTRVPRGTIFDVPYVRVQGGLNAVVLDPQAGDVGFCVFCSRDISAVKAAPPAATHPVDKDQPAPSMRQFDLADGLYLGGVLNRAPTQVVQFSADGIRLLSPSKVTIEAPTIELKGNVAQSGGNITATGTYTGDGNVTGAGISLNSHKHTGVQTGGSQTGGPV